MNEKHSEQIIEQLDDIKKLLILQSLDAGHTQGQIATALGITQGTISKMYPGGVPKVKK